MITTKNLLTIVVVLAIASGIFFLESRRVDRGSSAQGNVFLNLMDAQEKAKTFKPAIEISSPDGFINTDNKPITIGEFVGKKVVLLDVWTYSCINCQRTTPYLNSWYEKYEDDGLVIIGLHTPEFDFEKKYENVLEAVNKFGIKFPVVLDNDYSTWNAYGNRYWPRKYLIDIDGFIVYDHIGEGAYEETERKIQELLAERKARLDENGFVEHELTKEIEKINVPLSPETYFGASRNEFLGNGNPFVIGKQSLKTPKVLASNMIYLEGDWNFEQEYAETLSKGKIVFKYTAGQVFLVAESDTPMDLKILNDDKVVSEDAGMDVKNGIVSAKEPRLYKLIDNGSVGEHTLEIQIPKSGVKIFTFTFGS